MLLATFEENGEETALCIKNNIDSNHLEKLRQMFGLKWIIEGAEVQFADPDISITGLCKMSIGGHLVCRSILELLELSVPSVSPRLAISLDSYNNLSIDETKNQIVLSLHDGSQSLIPNLTKKSLSQKINHLGPKDQIMLLGDIFSCIQEAVSTKYTHKKLHFFDRSGKEIAADHIKILKNKLIEIVKAHHGPGTESFRKYIEIPNVRQLIDFDRSTHAEKRQGETQTRKEIYKLFPSQESVYSLRHT
jgi:hypothetical protein